jgi:hypothetical protein
MNNTKDASIHYKSNVYNPWAKDMPKPNETYEQYAVRTGRLQKKEKTALSDLFEDVQHELDKLVELLETK